MTESRDVLAGGPGLARVVAVVLELHDDLPAVDRLADVLEILVLALIEALLRRAGAGGRGVDSDRDRVIRIAKREGATLRALAEATGLSRQTIANICAEHEQTSRKPARAS